MRAFGKGVYPPIEKLEGPLHILVNCEKLSLSTNLIVNIQNLQVRHNRQSLQFFKMNHQVLKNLKVLSLGRNLVKSLQGIEVNAASCNFYVCNSYLYICNAMQTLHLLFLRLQLLSNICMFYIQGAAETLEQLWISYNQVKPHSSTIHLLSIWPYNYYP